MTVLSTHPPASAVVPATGTRRTVLRTSGPALLIAAGYIDPGNWGTDVAAGTQFGFRLIWVLAAATIAALFLQQLATRLGLAAGQDLATLIRTRLPVPARRAVVPPLLGALAVTEIVEVLGVVLGVQMLTGWSALPAAATAAALLLVILCAPGQWARRLTYGCLALIAIVYLGALCMHGAGPVIAGIRPNALPPGGLPIAVGLVGSLVMPHNILFHSALARDLTQADRTQRATSRLLRCSLLTSAIALGTAFAINAAITCIASGGASAGGAPGLHTVLGGLEPAFGRLAAFLFAMTLLASGLASSISGGLASVDVLKGLLPALTLRASARRMLFILPAAAVAASDVPAVTVLLWSQVVLTCTLPLVLVPLVCFTRRSDIMGVHASTRTSHATAVGITALLTSAAFLSLVTA